MAEKPIEELAQELFECPTCAAPKKEPCRISKGRNAGQTYLEYQHAGRARPLWAVFTRGVRRGRELALAEQEEAAESA